MTWANLEYLLYKIVTDFSRASSFFFFRLAPLYSAETLAFYLSAEILTNAIELIALFFIYLGDSLIMPHVLLIT